MKSKNNDVIDGIMKVLGISLYEEFTLSQKKEVANSKIFRVNDELQVEEHTDDDLWIPSEHTSLGYLLLNARSIRTLALGHFYRGSTAYVLRDFGDAACVTAVKVLSADRTSGVECLMSTDTEEFIRHFEDLVSAVSGRVCFESSLKDGKYLTSVALPGCKLYHDYSDVSLEANRLSKRFAVRQALSELDTFCLKELQDLETTLKYWKRM